MKKIKLLNTLSIILILLAFPYILDYIWTVVIPFLACNNPKIAHIILLPKCSDSLYLTMISVLYSVMEFIAVLLTIIIATRLFLWYIKNKDIQFLNRKQTIIYYVLLIMVLLELVITINALRWFIIDIPYIKNFIIYFINKG